jgi:hypothetical protein
MECFCLLDFTGHMITSQIPAFVTDIVSLRECGTIIRKLADVNIEYLAASKLGPTLAQNTRYILSCRSYKRVPADRVRIYPPVSDLGPFLVPLEDFKKLVDVGGVIHMERPPSGN